MNKWYEKITDQSDIYVASRIRLVRNLREYPFPCRLSDTVNGLLTDILQGVCKALEEELGRELHSSTFAGFSALQMQALKERRIINKSIQQKKHPMGLTVSGDESLSIVYNGDDHIRMQVSVPGLSLEEAWRTANQVDDFYNKRFEYAFDEKLGYLTTFPTNAGTGMRGYVLLHLPFLSAGGGLQKLNREISRYGLVIKGAFGDLEENPGDIVVLSNQKTLGISEADIMEVLTNIAAHLASQEARLREKSLKQNYNLHQDRIYKAYGILKYARMLELSEALNCLSSLKWGICNGLVETAAPTNCYRLMLECQDANLQMLSDKPMEGEVLSRARAEYIRKYLPDFVS